MDGFTRLCADVWVFVGAILCVAALVRALWLGDGTQAALWMVALAIWDRPQ
jgi:hypothetical protein